LDSSPSSATPGARQLAGHTPLGVREVGIVLTGWADVDELRGETERKKREREKINYDLTCGPHVLKEIIGDLLEGSPPIV